MDLHEVPYLLSAVEAVSAGRKTTFDGADELLLILHCQRNRSEGASRQQAKQESENEMSCLPIFP